MKHDFLQLPRRTGQRGMSLVLVLLLLVILTLAGLAASTMSMNSERLARNTRDETIALQAAEAALRDARMDKATRQLDGMTGTSPTCDIPGFKGYCQYAKTGQQVWELYIEDPNKSVELGEMTGLTTAQKMPTVDIARSNGVSKQPRYLIEPLKEPVNIGFGDGKYVYRITAIGYGANPSTKVMVQEVVRF